MIEKNKLKSWCSFHWSLYWPMRVLCFDLQTRPSPVRALRQSSNVQLHIRKHGAGYRNVFFFYQLFVVGRLNIASQLHYWHAMGMKKWDCEWFYGWYSFYIITFKVSRHSWHKTWMFLIVFFFFLIKNVIWYFDALAISCLYPKVLYYHFRWVFIQFHKGETPCPQAITTHIFLRLRSYILEVTILYDRAVGDKFVSQAPQLLVHRCLRYFQSPIFQRCSVRPNKGECEPQLLVHISLEVIGQADQ